MYNNKKIFNGNISSENKKCYIFEKIHKTVGIFFKAINKHKKNSNKVKEKTNIATKEQYNHDKEEFTKKIKIEEKKSKIEKLQQLFENDKDTLKQMSNREIYELNLLYEKQIEDLKKKILFEKKKYDQLNS